MRVLFENGIIVMCKEALNQPGSPLIIVITINDEQITIDCRSSSRAREAHNTLLVDGYFDASAPVFRCYR